MTEDKFITQEIGSFRKPLYLSKIFHSKEGTPEFTELAQKATSETLRLFEEAGLQNIGVGGEMYRWEMYEHFARNISGLEFYGMVRSFDNRYYKKGSVTSKITRNKSLHADELVYVLDNTSRDVKVPITGPYTMMDWSFNEYYNDRWELANAYADIINGEVRELKKVWDSKFPGKKFQVQIDEPATTTHPDEMDIVVESINRSVEGISGAEFSLHVCYSKDYRLLYDAIPDLKLDGYNLEYANRDTLSLGQTSDTRTGYWDIEYFAEINNQLDSKKFLGVGVTDVHIDEVESVDLIKDRIRYATKFMGDPELVRINPDCGLRTRSREVGYQKLKNMVDARNQIMEEY